jgi:hypothetical protein
MNLFKKYYFIEITSVTKYNTILHESKENFFLGGIVKSNVND